MSEQVQLKSLRSKTCLCDGHTFIREEIYNRTPEWLQYGLSWLTGHRAHTSEVHIRRSVYYLLIALMQVIGGMFLSVICFSCSGIIALFFGALGMMISTAGMGLFQVSVFHYCAHYTFFDTKRKNTIIGGAVGKTFLIGDFIRYREKHMKHHRSSILISEEDEFVEFIIKTCGLVPGARKGLLWWRIVLQIISPLFHAKFFYKRIAASYSVPSLKAIIIALLIVFILLHATLPPRILLTLWASCVLPFTILFQITIVLRTLCEHVVPDVRFIEIRGRDFISEATRGVFAGVRPPKSAQMSFSHFLAWTGWWANMLSIQLIFRTVILVGDAPCHDLHHRKPGSRDWVNYIQARHVEKEFRAASGSPHHHEVWGMFAAIDSCLDSISNWDG